MFVESGLIIIGILGLAIRRNLIAIGFSFILLFAGILLWLESLTPRSEIATVLTLVFILQILLYGVLSIFVWRHKGTLHLDEIRELRG